VKHARVPFNANSFSYVKFSYECINVEKVTTRLCREILDEQN